MIADRVLLYYSVFMVLVHLIIVIGIIKACRMSKQQACSEKRKELKVSIIIPAKDEETNLPILFRSLEKVLSPDVQLILANDRSSDRTRSFMDEFASEHPNTLVLTNTKPPREGMNPKHSMLATASKYATGDVIMFTDADCTVPENWIDAVCRYFQDPEIGLVFSAVVTEPGSGIVKRYQTQDHLQRFFYTVGAVGLGSPSGGFGNNLAIRRSALEEIGGFEAIGFSLTEDAQLIAAVRNSGHWLVAVCPFREALVYARPQKKLADAAAQEMRWSAGAIFGTDRMTALMYSFMLVFTLVGSLSFIYIPFHGSAIVYYLAPVISMVMVSSVGAWYLKCDKSFWLWIVPCALVGTLFYGFTYLAAFFIKSVSWKGTNVKK